MTDKRQYIIILLVVAALLGVAIYYIVPVGEKTRLGLDLQGGLEVVYKATVERPGQEPTAPTASEMEKALSIIERRVNGLGVTESQLQLQGSDQISVALPGVKDVSQALDVVGKTAQLKFYDDGVTRVAGPASSLDAAFEEAKKNPQVTLTPAERKDLAAMEKTAKERRASGGGEPVADSAVADGLSSDSLVVVTAAPGKAGGNTDTQYFIYRDEPAMMGDAVKAARQAFDPNSPGQKPIVEMDFTDAGGKQFQEITKTLWDRGSFTGVAQQFAIVLDGKMESDPQIDYTDPGLSGGIQGGKAIITGQFTIKEAKDLALVLNFGALPVKLEAIQSQEVSATLGKDSLNQALYAGLVGLGLVLIYMVAFYRFLGVIADLALIIYAILLWGLFNFIPVTLTLPGIAGMILTIGVAADANVVIFERIKEETRHGRTVRSAINSGYKRGFKTILDANVLTLLTAACLFVFATAQPKGFALTLILGVLVSMFTAVLATRAMLGLLSGYSFFAKASFMGVKASDIESISDAKPATTTDAGRARQRRPGTSGKKKR